jgi:hypothetical protein
MAIGTKTIFYIGKLFRTTLKHPRYGTFAIDLKTGSCDLPVEYADLLLSISPNLFTEENPNKAAVGADYNNMTWPSLKKYAEDRGIETRSRKRGDIIADLVSKDAEAKKE